MKNLEGDLWNTFTGKTKFLNLGNEVKYKLMLEAVNDIMWEWNISENKLSMFGNNDFLINLNMKDINDINTFIDRAACPEYKDKVKLNLKSYLEGKCMHFESEFKIYTKNNEKNGFS
ncbi:MAG: hypothetical protein ABF633_13750 [Clostridium sp.]|uniref:hypothetical protein n=1 Tax=Clostridium sp. TaxID=1506 RepID=UPI0039EC6491